MDGVFIRLLHFSFSTVIYISMVVDRAPVKCLSTCPEHINTDSGE